MANGLVVILMGSKADQEHCRKIARSGARARAAKRSLRIGSAHKTPQHVIDMLHAVRIRSAAEGVHHRRGPEQRAVGLHRRPASARR